MGKSNQQSPANFFEAKNHRWVICPSNVPATKWHQHWHLTPVIGRKLCVDVYTFHPPACTKRAIFKGEKRGPLRKMWPANSAKTTSNICRLFSTAGESLPLATSNQILIRFTSKGKSSSKGFHLAYQGECTVWVPVAAVSLHAHGDRRGGGAILWVASIHSATAEIMFAVKNHNWDEFIG